MAVLLRMGELTFTVIGVFRERVATYGLSEMQEDSVLIPLPLMKYYKGQEVLSSLYAQASVAGPSRLRRTADGSLAAQPASGRSRYDVRTLTAILGAARTISFALT